MTKHFNLSEEKHYHSNYKCCYLEEDIQKLINLITAKVFMDWKGQNEFSDWLKKIVGEEFK